MKMIHSIRFYKPNFMRKRCISTQANGHHHENYQVFQHKNITYNHDINIQDVEDHLDAVHKLKKTDKDDYFMSHGLDYDRCYEYINIVKYLNRCWIMRQTAKQNDDNRIHRLIPFIPPGWTILGVIAFVYYFVKDDL